MQTTPPQIDPEQPGTQHEAPSESGATVASGAHVSVVPHEPTTGTVTAPVRIRTNRYGDLEEHELIHLLDTIEDERARARFRESIYISVFVWVAIAWVLFYGPKYLWHAPQLITPTEALQQQALVQLNAPRIAPHAPSPPPRVDRSTIARLKEMEPKPAPTPPAPAAPAPAAETPRPTAQPTMQPANPVPSPALPSAPQPVQRSNAPVPDAPAPQANSHPTFSTPSTAGQDMRQAMQGSQSAGSSRRFGVAGNSRGANMQGGVEVLSDTQGVNFQPYLQRIMHLIYEQWIPLLPEETWPPLNKRGTTLIRFTINPDGSIAAMNLDGSSHDDALNRAAWGSITGVGQFPPLPKQFHGPNLELRVQYLVNQPQE